MFYLLYTFIFFSINATTIFDQDMQKAKELFDKQKYQEAVEVFNSLNKNTQGRSSAVLFNIANCYFKMGKHGYAKAYFLKARNISPRDEDILYNLAYVDSVIGAEPEGPILKITSFASIDEAYIAILVFFALGLVFSMLYIWGRKNSKPSGYHLFLAGAFLILFMFSLFFTVVKIINDKDLAVLLSKNNIKAAPTETATVLAELPEGARIYVKEKSGDWVRVSFKDDFIGWIKKDSIMELEL